MNLRNQQCRACGKVIHAVRPDGKLNTFTRCPQCGAENPYARVREMLPWLVGVLFLAFLLWYFRAA